jgi:hypothetical protein
MTEGWRERDDPRVLFLLPSREKVAERLMRGPIAHPVDPVPGIPVKPLIRRCAAPASLGVTCLLGVRLRLTPQGEKGSLPGVRLRLTPQGEKGSLLGVRLRLTPQGEKGSLLGVRLRLTPQGEKGSLLGVWLRLTPLGGESRFAWFHRPSPLWGGSVRRTGVGGVCGRSGAPYSSQTPHPPLRGTFSRKGRRKSAPLSSAAPRHLLPRGEKGSRPPSSAAPPPRRLRARDQPLRK